MRPLDDSRACMRDMIERKVQFVFTKWGDAEIEWLFGIGGGAAEREVRTPEKANLMMEAWLRFCSTPNLWIGDWRQASFGPGGVQYAAEYARMLSWLQTTTFFVHYETFLMMDTHDELRELYRAIRIDRRRKMLVAPQPLMAATDFLGAEIFHEAAWSDGCDFAVASAMAIIERVPDFKVGLFAAGRASKIMMSLIAKARPDATLIDLGSGLDPLFIGRTRSQQISAEHARLLHGL